MKFRIPEQPHKAYVECVVEIQVENASKIHMTYMHGKLGYESGGKGSAHLSANRVIELPVLVICGVVPPPMIRCRLKIINIKIIIINCCLNWREEEPRQDEQELKPIMPKEIGNSSAEKPEEFPSISLIHITEMYQQMPTLSISMSRCEP